MNEIIFRALKDSGFNVSSVAKDEDGYEHKIEFSNDICCGEIHTSEINGIIYVKASDA